jgi:hypothetical protein
MLFEVVSVAGMLSLSTHCSPIRISIANKETMTITVKVKNTTDKPLMASVDFEVPKDLAFDGTGVSNKKNIKIGEIPPGAIKDAPFEVFATHRASQNDYTARIVGYVHYRDYNNVLEKTMLNATVRVLE